MARPEDDVIRRAQEIIEANQSSEAGKPISIGLTLDTAKHLKRILRIDLLINRGLLEAINRPDQEGITHPENINSVLFHRLTDAIARIEGDQPEAKETSTVSVVFNEREVDYLNEELLGYTKPLKITEDSTYKELISNMNEKQYREAMGAFRDLNAAFIAAGGRPQPAYTRIFGRI